jgi:hypothetical protein
MARRLSFAIDSASHPPQHGLQRWQSVRTWARLIREAEALWRVDVRALHRLAALELGQLVQEVPPRLRGRVNRWLARFGVITRLPSGHKKTGWGSRSKGTVNR